MHSPRNPSQQTADLPMQARGHERHCFVVMPFGHTPVEARRFKGWYNAVIEPAILEASYEPKLAATEEQPSAINDDIRAHLAFDPMVVVDLGGFIPESEPNPNVMYELGIRHALGLPLVMMAWRDQRLPFDVGNQRVIKEDRDFLDLETNKQKLINFIKAAERGQYYKPMDAVARAATLDLAPATLGEDSLLVALVQEVKDLRQAVVAAQLLRSQPPEILEQALEWDNEKWKAFIIEQGNVWRSIAAAESDWRGAYVPEEKPSMIARYLLARLPSNVSVSDELANEIALMLIGNKKADAVIRLSKETGLTEQLAQGILTQVNVQRTKDDLLRSVRLS